MKKHTLLAACLSMTAALSMAAPTLQPDLAQGKATVEKMCIACHTLDGNSAAPIYPSLAGQHVEYLQKQLYDFKTEKRVNDVMVTWASQLTDQDIVNVSTYYASQTLKLRTAGNQQLADTGAKIYRGGILNKHVPACMACHGPNGAGIPSQYPQLTSQHATYIETQLLAFKKEQGGRTNDPAQMMQTIAAKLSDEEIKAVAEYISGLR